MEKMIKCENDRSRYIVATFIVLALLMLTWGLIPIRFETNDDVGIMYIVAGYRTGTPTNITMFTNVIYGYMMSGLYSLVPNFPWYGFAHVFFIFISLVLILKSMLKLAVSKNTPIYIPIGFFILLYYFFFFYYSSALQFTTTPAIMGAAACVLMLSLFFDETYYTRVLESAFIVTLIFCAYIFRPSTGTVVILYFGFIVLFKVVYVILNKAEKQSRLIVLFTTCICITIVLISAWAFDRAEARTNGMDEFRIFNTQRAMYMDFRHVRYTEAPELYHSIGWDEDLYALTRSWFFIDRRVTLDNLTAINEYTQLVRQEKSTIERVHEALDNIQGLLSNDRVAMSSTIVLIAIFIIHTIFLIFKKKWLSLLFILTLMVGFVTSCLYLGFQGRFILRVYFVTMIPAASLLFWSVIENNVIPYKRRVEKIVCLVMLIVLTGYFVVAPFRLQQYRRNFPTHTVRMEQRLAFEQYAAERPDNIYVFNSQLVNSTVPVFLTYGVERPSNVFFWGGAGMFSPIHNAQLKANGLTELYSESLLNSGFYLFATDIEAGIMDVFLRYMENMHQARPVIIDEFSGIIVVSFILE